MDDEMALQMGQMGQVDGDGDGANGHGHAVTSPRHVHVDITPCTRSHTKCCVHVHDTLAAPNEVGRVALARARKRKAFPGDTPSRLDAWVRQSAHAPVGQMEPRMESQMQTRMQTRILPRVNSSALVFDHTNGARVHC